MKLILEKELFDIYATEKIARYFYDTCLKTEKNATIFFEGGLGVGKTLFIQSVLHQAGIDQSIPSPTYTFVQEYNTETQCFAHFDFYRFENAQEFFVRGFDEIAQSECIKCVEWPGKLTVDMRKGFSGTTYFIRLTHGLGVGMRKIRIKGDK